MASPGPLGSRGQLRQAQFGSVLQLGKLQHSFAFNPAGNEIRGDIEREMLDVDQSIRAYCRGADPSSPPSRGRDQGSIG